jgi:hypothetical protein
MTHASSYHVITRPHFGLCCLDNRPGSRFSHGYCMWFGSPGDPASVPVGIAKASELTCSVGFEHMEKYGNGQGGIGFSSTLRLYRWFATN